jgi:hypothetical protein
VIICFVLDVLISTETSIILRHAHIVMMTHMILMMSIMNTKMKTLLIMVAHVRTRRVNVIVALYGVVV